MAVAATLMLVPTSAFCQRGGFSRGGFSGGGFSPDAMFDRLDDDGSGVIEPEEIENSRMRFIIERMDIDTSRGLTRDDLSEGMDRMRERFDEGGGFGFRRGSRGRRDDDRDRRRRDRGNASPNKEEPPPRVTMDLPEDFVAGDTDRDGQIGLYEWTRWKSRAALGEFLGLDRDGDGFLTPRELARAAEAKPVDVATHYPANTQGSTPAARSSRGARSSTTAAASSAPKPAIEASASNVSLLQPVETQAVIAAADQGQVRQAERLFSLLDKDRDGNISETEWSVSSKLKPRFEKAGVDFAKPMSSDVFVSYYVRIYAKEESI